jgi:adenine phosphoribosyltransferase
MTTDLSKYIRSIPDFPKKGIDFKDVTTIWKDPIGFQLAVDQFLAKYFGQKIDKVVGIESRGFVFGAALALRLHAGFVPVRKKGKLPASVISEEYALEYGADTIEIHKDAIQKGEKILLHDDLLATGGTMQAAAKLITKLGGEIVGISFLVELTSLKGRTKLAPYDVFSLIQFEGE